MKRNEILGEQKKGVKAVKYNKKPKDHAAEFGKAKEKLAPQKPLEEGMEEGYRSRRDAYQRDYDSSQTGFSRGHDHRGLEQELAHETNNYAVAIDGRTWKVFASKNHAQAVARSLQNKGKNATVHETGAEPTAEAMGADMGKITKVDPATKKATLTKPDGSSMEVDSTALKPTPDGKMSIDTPDADELKTGTAVVSTENAMSSPNNSGLMTMPTDEYVKGIYAAAAENGMDAPEAEAVKKQMVLAPNGEVDVMATMQKALQAFNSPEWKQMLADLDALIKKEEAQQASNPELGRIQELAGVTGDAVSPRFAGVQKTQHADGSQTTDYQQGPLQTTQKVDAQGRPITSKSSYELGVAKVDTELDHKSGVRSNAVTTPGMDPNELLPTADIAAARGADPKKFAKFQQQNPSAVKSEALEAMLRIAGLR